MSVRETTVPGYFSTHLVPADASGAAKRLAARAIGFGGGASDNNKRDRGGYPARAPFHPLRAVHVFTIHLRCFRTRTLVHSVRRSDRFGCVLQPTRLRRWGTGLSTKASVGRHTLGLAVPPLQTDVGGASPAPPCQGATQTAALGVAGRYARSVRPVAKLGRNAPHGAMETDCMSLRFPFDNSYARLPARLYARLDPTPVAAPRLVRVNAGLAESLGLDPEELASPEGVEILAGNRVPEGATPIALAYAGHQFGHFVPQLGDGRAILLGEVVGRDGARRDIQLKGSGRTPFSRDGDGRAALGPVLREYIVSEAMAALGVPTTRALAAVTTGEPVRRETMLPGAVLTRVAASHIRVGTFQYFAARGDTEALRLLADYVIARHYPRPRRRSTRTARCWTR